MIVAVNTHLYKLFPILVLSYGLLNENKLSILGQFLPPTFWLHFKPSDDGDTPPLLEVGK